MKNIKNVIWLCGNGAFIHQTIGWVGRNIPGEDMESLADRYFDICYPGPEVIWETVKQMYAKRIQKWGGCVVLETNYNKWKDNKSGWKYVKSTDEDETRAIAELLEDDFEEFFIEDQNTYLEEYEI